MPVDLVPHGGLDPAELIALGVDPAIAVDFSSSTNPYGPHPEVLAAARNARLDRYPDRTAAEARRALAKMCEVEPERIVLGNGAAELLWTVARALVPQASWVRIAEPTFGEFRAAIASGATRILDWRAQPRDDFAIHLDALGATRADCLYLCNPNTPTGASVPLAEIARLAARMTKTRVVLDESFLSLSDRAAEAKEPMPDNVVRIRSLTKDHGLPGLRLGYAIVPAPIAAVLERSRPAWTVSAPAQAAAIAAAAHTDFVEQSRLRMRADRERLAAELARAKLTVVPSTAPFLLVHVGQATPTRARLLRRGVVVRDCTSFGLPEHIRVAARPEIDRLLEALA